MTNLLTNTKYNEPLQPADTGFKAMNEMQENFLLRDHHLSIDDVVAAHCRRTYYTLLIACLTLDKRILTTYSCQRG